MRSLFSPIPFAASLCLLMLGLGTHEMRSAPPAPITVEVREEGLFIEGKAMTRDATLADYEALLGKPDRTTRLRNTIYTYDERGIRLYQKPDGGPITSVALDLIPANYAFSPKGTFKGILMVAGRTLGTQFPQTALLELSGVKMSARERTLALPATQISYGKNTLIMEYLKSRETLEGVGISWLE
jgi:hypothetical protein